MQASNVSIQTLRNGVLWLKWRRHAQDCHLSPLITTSTQLVDGHATVTSILTQLNGQCYAFMQTRLNCCVVITPDRLSSGSMKLGFNWNICQNSRVRYMLLGQLHLCDLQHFMPFVYVACKNQLPFSAPGLINKHNFQSIFIPATSVYTLCT